jgi:hypothetical protein
MTYTLASMSFFAKERATPGRHPSSSCRAIALQATRVTLMKRSIAIITLVLAMLALPLKGGALERQRCFAETNHCVIACVETKFKHQALACPSLAAQDMLYCIERFV